MTLEVSKSPWDQLDSQLKQRVRKRDMWTIIVPSSDLLFPRGRFCNVDRTGGERNLSLVMHDSPLSRPTAVTRAACKCMTL